MLHNQRIQNVLKWKLQSTKFFLIKIIQVVNLIKNKSWTLYNCWRILLENFCYQKLTNQTRLETLCKHQSREKISFMRQKETEQTKHENQVSKRTCYIYWFFFRYRWNSVRKVFRCWFLNWDLRSTTYKNNALFTGISLQKYHNNILLLLLLFGTFLMLIRMGFH